MVGRTPPRPVGRVAGADPPRRRRCPAALLAAALLPAAGSTAASDSRLPDDYLQVLEFRIEMDPADWDAVRNDRGFDRQVPALFRCESELPLPVRVRRKRSAALPSDDEPFKVSLKIDFNEGDPEGNWHGYPEIGLENGIQEEITECSLVREGLAWIIMARSGVIAGGVSWARLSVNGAPVGVYTRIEQVDKSFLRRHLGEDDGFLYKLDRHAADGNLIRRLTREDEPDPYQDFLCFPPFGDRCPAPPDSSSRLREHLDLHQLVTMGAVNTIIGNSDGLLEADNNYFWYNSIRPRVYFPWDLDLTFSFNLTRFPHVSEVERLLFAAAPGLRRYADAILLGLLNDLMAPESIDRLLDDLAAAIGPDIAADPLNGLSGSFEVEMATLRAWIHARVDFLKKHIPPQDPEPLALNEVQAWNAGGVLDEGGEAADWVEIYNRGPAEANLSGLFLSDDPAAPLKWPLPAAVLPPGGRYLVWCDGDAGEGPAHAGFKLDRDGEAVGLYRIQDGLVRALDFVRFGPQEPGVSWGRVPDGAPGPRRLPCPTPGAENRADCPPAEPFVRGDVTADGRLDQADVVDLLRGMFLGQPLSCWDAADVDDDGRPMVLDVVLLLLRLYRGGDPPRPPFPECGPDPTSDPLGCRSAPVCGG